MNGKRVYWQNIKMENLSVSGLSLRNLPHLLLALVGKALPLLLLQHKLLQKKEIYVEGQGIITCSRLFTSDFSFFFGATDSSSLRCWSRYSSRWDFMAFSWSGVGCQVKCGQVLVVRLNVVR